MFPDFKGIGDAVVGLLDAENFPDHRSAVALFSFRDNFACATEKACMFIVYANCKHTEICKCRHISYRYQALFVKVMPKEM